MARFVMANRRAGKFHESEKKAARASMDASFSQHMAGRVDVVSDNRPADGRARRVVLFEGDSLEVTAQARRMPPDVIVEPEILHYVDQRLGIHSDWLPFAADSLDIDPGRGQVLGVQVEGRAGGAIEGAKAVLYLRGAGPRSVVREALTPASGAVSFEFSAYWEPTALVVLPPGGYWNRVVRGPRHPVTVALEPLPQEGPLGWWHRRLGVDAYDPARGQGIVVGVIDTGVRPHGSLDHVHDAGAFVDARHDPAGGADSDAHGSHVCGTIGARPGAQPHYAGIAPGVDLVSARVFPTGRGANQGDIALAIDHLSRQWRADLINLSLGAPVGSELEHDAILDALERGTLCVCAAGNSNGAVEYPAAFDEVIAVSALGLEGWGPDGSLTATRYPTQADRYGLGQLYLANFSCFGPEIDCCAPGVGILATVPERFGLRAPIGAMDGTSMASPAACATLAAILSNDADYRSLPRDLTRAERARSLLRQGCVDVGLAAHYQGRGMPRMR